MTRVAGFLLTRQWEDVADHQRFVFWLTTDDGPVRIIVDHAESVFFVAQAGMDRVRQVLGASLRVRIQPIALETFHSKAPVAACYFATQRDLVTARHRLMDAGLTVYEADVRPTDRYLMERFIRGCAVVQGEPVSNAGVTEFHNPHWEPGDNVPQLKVLSIDIETSITRHETLSIAAYGQAVRRVFMVSASEVGGDVTICADERELITRFLSWLREIDPDVLIGWSVVAFDLHFLQQRCDALGMSFSLGRDDANVRWREISSGRRYALVPGRVVLDGIELLRTATYRFESFSLEFVAQALLDRGKQIEDVDNRAGHIEALFETDKAALAAYNLEDCRLVYDIFADTELVAFAIQRARLTGLEMYRMGASVAAFDYLYLPRLHREGLVAPVIEEAVHEVSPGGFVMDSRAGLFDDVLVLDFKSLYPSIIRTFHVDPLALTRAEDGDIPGFKGGLFSREHVILPSIIDDLWRARDQAKLHRDDANSQAIKIIMNSFYGVLGTTGCRFFDARLASSITMRGHEILKRTRSRIEAAGYPVIYGDTDSVFVHVGGATDDPRAAGQALAADLNAWWRTTLDEEFGVTSFLEIEFETHFSRFFMPTVRGSDAGSKKRYAGLVTDGDGQSRLVFKGLETVRTDWSPLAREFQQELYRRIFNDEPFVEYVRDVVRGVLAGERDDQLVLRRRLRRGLGDYTRQVPPHVRAARIEAERSAEAQAEGWLLSGSRWVAYIMTTNGAEPVRYRESPIDYQFYVDRQLTPIADAILRFRDTSLALLTDRQLGLF